jgi:hypothetical protein
MVIEKWHGSGSVQIALVGQLVGAVRGRQEEGASLLPQVHVGRLGGLAVQTRPNETM